MFKKISFLLSSLLIFVFIPNIQSESFTCKKKIIINDFIENHNNIYNESDIFLMLKKLKKKQNYIGSNTNNNGPCNLCKFIVDIIKRELIISNQTIIEIEKIVKDICSHLSNKEKKIECFEIINDIDLIKNLILDGVNPKDICVKINFCKNITS